jgi:hypothetical protein
MSHKPGLKRWPLFPRIFLGPITDSTAAVWILSNVTDPAGQLFRRTLRPKSEASTLA